MEITAASASAYQQASLQNEVALAVAGKAKDNLELQGAMALQLLESAASAAVDPSSPLGQNIDIMA
ncbi:MULTISPECIES: putative motility protein [Amphritea]|uniref:Motility protein n=2 Tax=Amphritea TaxID=515417 RepID=A0ABS2WD15_9GAMM|nr:MULTISPECIES: putative motility protein [Amphritea]MBN0989615.1 putative motility protein [Amphritea pacifica]MBN1006556.1 putative motility protein [Amphritea pacifica]SEQ58791.1 Putative motility protein [Amphritea atlantica]